MIAGVAQSIKVNLYRLNNFNLMIDLLQDVNSED
jgi:hypothetical protein